MYLSMINQNWQDGDQMGINSHLPIYHPHAQKYGIVGYQNESYDTAAANASHLGVTLLAFSPIKPLLSLYHTPILRYWGLKLIDACIESIWFQERCQNGHINIATSRFQSKSWHESAHITDLYMWY